MSFVKIYKSCDVDKFSVFYDVAPSTTSDGIVTYCTVFTGNGINAEIIRETSLGVFVGSIDCKRCGVYNLEVNTNLIVS